MESLINLISQSAPVLISLLTGVWFLSPHHQDVHLPCSSNGALFRRSTDLVGKPADPHLRPRGLRCHSAADDQEASRTQIQVAAAIFVIESLSVIPSWISLCGRFDDSTES